MFSWLVACTADALNKLKVHDDGNEAYERTLDIGATIRSLALASHFVGR